LKSSEFSKLYLIASVLFKSEASLDNLSAIIILSRPMPTAMPNSKPTFAASSSVTVFIKPRINDIYLKISPP
jgi:hypothetical protein